MSTETIELSVESQELQKQGLLFSHDVEVAVREEEERKGIYTAARVKVQRPLVYDAILELLKHGKGMAAIGKLLGVHHKTVAAVRDSHPEPIDTARSKRVQQLLTLIDLQIERAIENPSVIPANVIGLTIGQLIDKVELLSGRATARIESTEPVDIQKQYREFLAGLTGGEKRLGPDQVRELPSPAIRSLDGKKLPTGPAPAISAADPGAEASAGSDLQSPTLTREDGSDVTSSVTSGEDSGPDSRAGETPRGGDHADPPGAAGQSHNCTSKISDNAPDAPPTPPL